MPAREPEPGAAEADAITPEALRDAMAHVPTPVTVVTAFGPHGPSGLTANAVVSLSLNPPLMLACLDRGSRTLRAVEQAGRFGINVLEAGQAGVARSFGTKAATHEKWEGISWSERDGMPALDGALVWVACELRDVLAGGDHVIVTGAVLDAVVGSGEPLVFHGGGYRPI